MANKRRSSFKSVKIRLAVLSKSNLPYRDYCLCIVKRETKINVRHPLLFNDNRKKLCENRRFFFNFKTEEYLIYTIILRSKHLIF